MQNWIVFFNNKIDIDHAILEIPEFRIIREEFKDDKEFEKVITLIYFLVDPRSPYYQNYEWEERIKEVSVDIMREKWLNLPENIEKACNKFTQIFTTPVQKLLHSAQGAIHKIKYFLDEVIVNEDSIAKVVKTLGEIGKIQDNIDRLETKIKKDLSNSKTRADYEPGKYEK